MDRTVVEEARRRAHQRGGQMRPATGDIFIPEPADIFDIIYVCLDETHPQKDAPSQKYQRVAFDAWVAEKEQIRADLWDAFNAGLCNEPFKVAAEAVAA